MFDIFKAAPSSTAGKSNRLKLWQSNCMQKADEVCVFRHHYQSALLQIRLLILLSESFNHIAILFFNLLQFPIVEPGSHGAQESWIPRNSHLNEIAPKQRQDKGLDIKALFQYFPDDWIAEERACEDHR